MKSLLLISYYSTLNKGVMSNWVQDKLNILCEFNKVTLITSITNPKIYKFNLQIIRVPSISPIRFIHELKSINSLVQKLKYIVLYGPIIFSIGFIYLFFERVILRREGGGIWSFTPIATLVSYYLLVVKKIKIVYSTGGPASAHLVNVIISKLHSHHSIVELQDPLVGEEIGHNVISSKMLLKLERIILMSVDKIVYNTKTAYNQAKKRYPSAKNIRHVYSSSFNYNLKNSNAISHEKNKLKLVHLGTLYSTRNFNNLIPAICKENIKNLKLINVGYVTNENIKQSNCVKVTYEDEVSRFDALRILDKNDIALLIQHTDNRSKTTIPYKTWDYLNSNKLIFALTNNRELDDLLMEHGHITANVKDSKDIQLKIRYLVNNYNSLANGIKANKYDFEKQTNQILSK